MDGKEWQEPMTKSQKKKAEKEVRVLEFLIRVILAHFSNSYLP